MADPDLYLKGDEHDSSRQLIVGAAESLDYEEDTVHFLARQRVSAGVFPHIPAWLEHVVSIAVPGEGTRGEDFVTVPCTAESLTIFRDSYSPSLAGTDITSLGPEQLLQFMQYVRAYQQYINEMLARINAQIRTLERRRQYATNEFTLLYRAEKQGIRKAMIEQEPYILTLTEKINGKITVRDALKVEATSLEDLASLGSRDLTRRGQEISQGLGDSIQTPKAPARSLRPARRQLSLPKRTK